MRAKKERRGKKKRIERGPRMQRTLTRTSVVTRSGATRRFRWELGRRNALFPPLSLFLFFLLKFSLLSSVSTPDARVPNLRERHWGLSGRRRRGHRYRRARYRISPLSVRRRVNKNSRDIVVVISSSRHFGRRPGETDSLRSLRASERGLSQLGERPTDRSYAVLRSV